MAEVNRPMSRMRKIESKEALFRTRKRILKHLILGYLKQEGYFRTAETLVDEAQLSPEFELCDNIHLDIILQVIIIASSHLMVSDDDAEDESKLTKIPQPYGELAVYSSDYCSYYMLRFNKQPQFLRKLDEAPLQRPKTRRAERRTPPEELAEKPGAVAEADLPFGLTVKQLNKEAASDSSISAIERKPLSGFLSNLASEKRQLAELVYQDILRPSGVSWDDVKGLAEAKSLLVESVVYPVRYPEVFTGLLEPWRGVLLHGPPGTGKTMLARAVAAESCCTFFNVSCSTVVNKWRGESEKIVKVLFEMASYYSPSIIFIDEVETLASERSAPGEHEASRRLKSQLLTELDGVGGQQGVVFLLVNSNMPWEIDAAMLRRLEKRVYIPLPDFRTRKELFETFLSSKEVEVYPKVDYEEFARKTEGYSGSDIKLVCKEALMATVRKMLPNMSAKGVQTNRKEKLLLSDILTAIEKTKPVSKNLAKRHEIWQEEMGCS